MKKRELWIGELKGILLIASGLAITLSLLSYHPGDLSLFPSTTTPSAGIKNILGYPGAFIAGLSFYLLGMVAYLLPLILFLIGGQIFWDRRPDHGVLYILGWLGILVSVCSLQELILPQYTSLHGWIGKTTIGLASYYLNLGGTYLLIMIVLLISISALLPGRMGYLLRRLPSVFKAIKRTDRRGKPSPQKGKMDTSTVRPSETQDIIQGDASTTGQLKPYQLPPLSLLDELPKTEKRVSDKDLNSKAELLVQRLRDFGIQGKINQILRGPVITMYEFEPAPGIKVSKIINLSDDLALAMKALSVRIVAPVPGKAVVGIEIPNEIRQPVYFREIIDSATFRRSPSKLTLALGKDILGNPAITDLAQIPHLLIAGATGSGKSVGLNCMICSLLFNATPDEVKLILIDPKMLELSVYEGIPHLLLPVVVDPKKAAGALKGIVLEMERRYQLMARHGVRHINQYNRLINKTMPLSREEGSPEPLPYIVVVIDELADLMLVSSKEVEDSIARLAQMARAAGIHLIVATQRPSVDVLTGVIKANFPARISYQVASKTDSRTILDTMGAERLLGKGDMLFLPPGTSKLQRVHGAFVSEKEIKRLVEFLKEQQPPSYNESLLRLEVASQEEDGEDQDEKYQEAVRLVARTRQASISMIQRKLRVGYNRAARMIEQMEKEGIVGPAEGAKPREVYIPPDIDL